MDISEEQKPFDAITFRINFNFSFLNLHYFRGKKETFFPRQNHHVVLLPTLSILLSFKLPQICQIVATVQIVLTKKQLFPGKPASGEGIFDQL